MAKYVAWVDGKECLDSECQAVGNFSSNERVFYCSTRCLVADGHNDTPMGTDDSHEPLGYWPSSYCEHCESCGTKVVQGIECDCECDDECITNMERLLAEAWATYDEAVQEKGE